MATAASQCSVALILMDASGGVLPQTRRHALICALMGVRRLLFVINKLDAVQLRETPFREVQEQCDRLAKDLERFGLPAAEYSVVPVSALWGDNLMVRSSKMPWYQKTTVMDWLYACPAGDEREQAPLRFTVQ
jgi:sulfate adenylyltransferase subunit 1 (EFTu-like GTPase family)